MPDPDQTDPRTRLINTAYGPARVRIDPPATGSGARGTCFLGHGAGGGFGSPDLAALGEALHTAGWVVVWVEQPWLVAGKKVAARPALLDQAWHTVVTTLTDGGGGTTLPHTTLPGTHLPGPYVHGGRSAGARVACRAATAADPGMPVAGLVLCSFPLHPPGKPQNTRIEELAGAVRTGIPIGIVQGSRDPFGTMAQVEAALGAAAPDLQSEEGRSPVIIEVPGTHSFAPASAPELTRACATIVEQLSSTGPAGQRVRPGADGNEPRADRR